jgi:branched-chain amino acid aminotransferase
MDDAIFLNREGRIAEAAGAALLVERDGIVITPPMWDGVLPSITVDVIERIAGETGIPFVREPIPLAIARAADGLALAGTLDQLVDVIAVDDAAVPPGRFIASLRRHYQEAITGSPLPGLLAFAEFSPEGRRCPC